MNKDQNKEIGIVALIIILGLITFNISSCNKVKNTRTELEEAKVSLEKVKTENVTLQKAIANPMIIEKPVEIIKWKEIIVEGPDLGAREIVERTVEIERRGEKIKKPFVPSMPLSSAPEIVRKDWTPIIGYNITDNYGTFGVGRRIYRSIKIYGEYNLNESIEVKTSIDF